MPKIIRAAFVYFGIVMGTGFALGMIRVPFLVPRMGERWAELMEMPIMAATVFLSAGFIVRRFPEIRTRGRALALGCLALGLAVSAELGLAVFLQSKTLAGYVGSRDRVSGSVYLLVLGAFGLMPWLRTLTFSGGAGNPSGRAE